MLSSNDTTPDRVENTCGTVGSSVTPADGFEGADREDSSSLSFRNYRLAASEENRNSFLQQDNRSLERIMSEIVALQELRNAANEKLSLSTTAAERQTAESDLHTHDTSLGAWCLRLALILHDGDYVLSNECAGGWVRLLYPILVDSTEFLFRHTNAWVGVAGCFINIGGRRKDANTSPTKGGTQTLPWRPLVAFLQQVFHLPNRFRETPALKHVQEKVKGYVFKFCSLSSDYFDENAFEELWEEFAPTFNPEGFQALQGQGYFVSLAPRFQMVATPRQRKLLDTALELFFIQSTTWHPSSLTWSHFSWALLDKVTPTMLALQGLDPVLLDTYAEPLFSSILHALRLPVGDTDMRRSLKLGGKTSIEMLVEDLSSSTLQRSHAVIADFFPDSVQSPLWAHLRRFIHAMEVFLRPTASVHQGLVQLTELLHNIVHQMVRRVDMQNKCKEKGIRALSFLSQASVNEFARIFLPPLLSLLYSNSRTITSGTHHALHGLCRIAPAVCFPEVVRLVDLGLSPNAENHLCTVALELLGNCTPELLLGDATLKSPPMSPLSDAESDGPQSTAAALGHWDVPSSSISERLELFLCSIGDQLLSKIDGSDFQRTMSATRIIFQSGVYFSLRTVCADPTAGGQLTVSVDAEQSFLLPLTDRMLSFGSNCEALPRTVTAAFFLSLTPVFAPARDETIALVAERVCRRCCELGEAGAVHPFRGLLQAIATRTPQHCWRKLFPTIKSKLLDPLSSVSEVRWFCLMLVGLINCGDRDVVFSFSNELFDIVDTLMIRVTSRERVYYAGEVYQATVLSLLRRHMRPQSSSTTFGVPPLFLAKEANLVLSKPTDAHIDFCVQQFNRRLAERLEDLRDISAAASKRNSQRNQFLGTRAGDSLPGDDDEPLSDASVRRSTLRIVRLLVESNDSLLAADESSFSATSLAARLSASTVAAPHLFTARHVEMPPEAKIMRLPRGGAEISVHVEDIIDVMLKMIPTVVGSGNYVAATVPPSLRDDEELQHRMANKGPRDSDTRSLRTIIKILFILCNAHAVVDSFIDPIQVLFENWRSQFKRASGTRRMPLLYWSLSAEIQEHSRLRAHAITVSNDIVISVFKHMHQLATHHRFEEVQGPARSLATTLVSIVGVDDVFAAAVTGTVRDLQMLSKEAAKMIASGAIQATSTNDEEDVADIILGEPKAAQAVAENDLDANEASEPEADTTLESKRFDHEISGAMRFLAANPIMDLFLSPRADRCAMLFEVLTEFPDMLLNKEELSRRQLYFTISSDRMVLGGSVDVVLPVIAKCIEYCSKLAASFPSRAGRWLELAAALWPRTFRLPAFTSLPEYFPVSLIVRLCVHEHLRLRTLAQHIFTNLLTSLKSRVPTTKCVVGSVGWADTKDALRHDQATRRANTAALTKDEARAPWFGLRSRGLWYTTSTVHIKNPAAAIATSALMQQQIAALSAAVGITLPASSDIKESWCWKMAFKFQDEARQHSKSRLHLWKALARVCGPAQAVLHYQRVFAALIDREELGWQSTDAVSHRKAMESQVGLASVVGELALAAVRATKYDAGGRITALAMVEALTNFVLSQHVSHEVIAIAQRSMMEMRHVLTAQEVETLLLSLIARLTHLLPHDQSSGTSQLSIRLLTLILQLLNTFSYDVITAAIPAIVKELYSFRVMLLGNPLSQVRNHCASVLRQALQCAWFAVPRASGDRDEQLGELLNKFAVDILREAVPTSDHAMTLATLNPSKANVVMWAYPPAPLVSAELIPSLLHLFTTALDVRLTEVDDITANVNGTLISIGFTRLEKLPAHAAMEECASILLGHREYGYSRHGKVTVSRVLRSLLFVNLHRVGKFATIKRMTEAALKCMENPDKRVRSEGKLLISIIVRVASLEQMTVIVKDLLQRLRATDPFYVGEPSEAETAAPDLQSPLPTYQPVRLSLCVALCGVVLADPDTVSPYTPKILERLARSARDRNPDVSSTVRQSLIEWWTSHRDKWNFSHKAKFNATQLNLLMELFTTPSYFA